MKAQAWNSLMAEGLSETQNYVLKLRYILVPHLMIGGPSSVPKKLASFISYTYIYAPQPQNTLNWKQCQAVS